MNADLAGRVAVALQAFETDVGYLVDICAAGTAVVAKRERAGRPRELAIGATSRETASQEEQQRAAAG